MGNVLHATICATIIKDGDKMKGAKNILMSKNMFIIYFYFGYNVDMHAKCERSLFVFMTNNPKFVCNNLNDVHNNSNFDSTIPCIFVMILYTK